ncbi:hypothetical protein CRG98_000311 [Punica granatum]|uniref:Uncharacterized protein n=1 Tax=Punica granatum TaxID=22663 RepID=A0A2I0LF30_PUNGR|nr:hypothetical protein CRG98_000311 [Punica granatum]
MRAPTRRNFAPLLHHFLELDLSADAPHAELSVATTPLILFVFPALFVLYPHLFFVFLAVHQNHDGRLQVPSASHAAAIKARDPVPSDSRVTAVAKAPLLKPRAHCGGSNPPLSSDVCPSSTIPHVTSILALT